MRNLILYTPSVAELRAILEANAPQPLLPTLDSPPWKAVAGNPIARPWIEQITVRAVQELDQPLPPLTTSLYADFHATGNRLNFERVYFEHRRRLNRAAIATLTAIDLTLQKRYLDSLLQKMQTLIDEPTWALPAHVRNQNGIDPMLIDLFAAETANLFGELLNVFGDHVPPAMKAIVIKRLSQQFWKNYLTGNFVWYTIANNWNAVCHQGVLGSALSVCDDASIVADMLHAAAPRMRLFLDGFSPDGGCSEGPGYWSYGFGWYCELNRQLERRSGGTLSLFDGDVRIKAIAEFGAVMMIEDSYTVNFSDCGPRGWPRPSLLRYLGERLDNTVLRGAAEVACRHSLQNPLNLDLERADFMFHARLLLACPNQMPAAKPLPALDSVYPVLAISLLRFTDDAGHLWEFACKGGHNEEFHNHNDLGGYLLHIDGQPIFTEIGAPEYVKDFFSSKRYEFNAARSLGHPVPLINGKEQAAGRQYSSKFTVKTLNADRAEYEIDLTAAYPATAGARSVVRTIVVEKRLGRITIVDDFQLESDGPAETAMVTNQEIALSGGGATIASGPIQLAIEPIEGSRLAEVQTLDFSDHDGHPDKAFRLAVRPAKAARSFRLGFTAYIG
jgi:hypothetical protein